MSENREKEKTFKIVIQYTDFKEEIFKEALGYEVDPYTFKIRDKDLGLHYINRQFVKKVITWEKKEYVGPDSELDREIRGENDEARMYGQERQRYSS